MPPKDLTASKRGSTGKKNANCSFCRKSYRDVGPLVEGPDVALFAADHLWSATLPFCRDPLLPEVGRLIDVRIRIDNWVIDAVRVSEDV